jgi:beta-glucanase (GH16 family)
MKLFLRGLLFALIFSVLTIQLFAQAGVEPKALIEPGAAAGQVSVKPDGQVTATTGADGIAVAIKAGDDPFPGITIKPASGAAWDLGLYGHVEAMITNTGTKRINLSLRVDNDGDYHLQPWNAESKIIEPGQTKTIRTYFGYSYGFKPGFKLNPQAVPEVLLFTGKTADDLSFRVDEIKGAGWVGEKIGVDPDRVAVKPPGGVILDAATTFQPGQIGMIGNAKGAAGPDGKLLQIEFAGGQEESVTFRPATGLWNLNEALELKVKLKNTGQTPVTPSVQIMSESGPSDTVATETPLAPGNETEIVVPFAAKIPWKAVTDPKQEDPTAKGSWDGQPGTCNRYSSNKTSGVTILSDTMSGAKSLLVSSIVADVPPLTLPEWLGQKPPVNGDWVQTLDEEFAGNALDPHRWNVNPGGNYWDKRMHFSKDEIIVQDGLLHLRLEKKPGHENDDPKGAFTDYAAGQPDTCGKWTQRYGYFEIREKQSTANCLWPGLWTEPDRGLAHGEKGRWEGEHGGMEFDITESQSAWGPYRFNTACHWDGYEGTHKSLGTSANYVQADKDGYITVGMLWLPGSVVFYGNGKEISRWDSPRVASVQEYLILQNEIGGWDNDPVDDAQLPADFLVKYIRVWQRKDLATPDDGPKPNLGGLDAFHETLTGTEGTTK